MRDALARLLPSLQRDTPKDNDGAARSLVSLWDEYRCPWDPFTGKCCTCEVRMCQCPAAYTQSDAATIALELVQLQKAGHLDTLVNSSTPKDGGAGQLHEFIVKAANGGMLAAANG